MNFGDMVQVGNVVVICNDARRVREIVRIVNPDIYFVDPPYEKTELYHCIPFFSHGKYLAVSWGYRSFSTACCAAESRGWEPMFEAVWDCVTSWYTPSNPLARHRSIGVYGKLNTFNLDAALIELPRVVDAMQCDIWGGEKNPNVRTVKNTRGSYEYEQSGKHLSTVFQYPNTQLKRNGYSHGKPVRWLSAILSGLQGNTVFDFFGGTGAVAEACLSIGRSCYVVEIEPEKCESIVELVAKSQDGARPVCWEPPAEHYGTGQNIGQQRQHKITADTME